jgi:L-asparagine oxygenase
MNQLTSDQISNLKSNGYLFLQGFEPDMPTYDVAAKIGITQDIRGIPTVQQLRPRDKYESSSNVYSGNYGLDEFPLHSDLAHWAMPPKYFLITTFYQPCLYYAYQKQP